MMEKLDFPSGKFESVTTGSQHSCGLRQQGSVQCWGENTYGETTPPE